MILNNIKGNTLLIVVVVTFSLLSIALYLNKFVLNQIKISNNITNYKSSIYAAESGVERSLYLIRKNGISLSNVVSNSSYNTGNLNNNSSYKITSTNSSSPIVTTPSVNLGTKYSFDITDYMSSMKSFKISWDSPGNESLFISIAGYNPGGHLMLYVINGNYNHYVQSPLTYNVGINPQNNITYKLELTPYYYPVTNVSITFYTGYNATGSIINVNSSSNSRIKSTGNFGNNNKSVYSDFLINSNY